MKTTDIGNAGESAVCRYLLLKGYHIIDRNFRTRFGEIDIIAQKGKYIAFVEVKTRKKNSKISGIYAVDSHKQQRIIMAAKEYILRNNCELQPRFDVAEVTHSGRLLHRHQIKYITNAFGV